MIAVVTTAGATQLTGRPLQPQGCSASLTRPPFRAALDPGASVDPAAGSTAGHGLPSPHAPPQLTRTRTRTRESEINNQPAWNPGPLRFLARMSSITWDRNVKHQVRPDSERNRSVT